MIGVAPVILSPMSVESATELVADGDGRNPLADMPVSPAAPGMYEWYYGPEQTQGVAPDVRTLERKLKEVYKETSQPSTPSDDASLSPECESKENLSVLSTSTRDARTAHGTPNYMQPTVVSIAKRKSLHRRLKDYGRKGFKGQSCVEVISERSELRSIVNSALKPQEWMNAVVTTDDSMVGKETPRELGEWKAHGQCNGMEAAGCQEQQTGLKDDGRHKAMNIVANSGSSRSRSSRGMKCLDQSTSKKVLCLPAFRTLKGKHKLVQDAASEGNKENNENLGFQEVSFKIQTHDTLWHCPSTVLEKQLPQSFDDKDSEGMPNAATGPLVGEKDMASFGSEFPGSPVSSQREVFVTPRSVQKRSRNGRKRSRLANLVCCLAPKLAE